MRLESSALAAVSFVFLVFLATLVNPEDSARTFSDMYRTCTCFDLVSELAPVARRGRDAPSVQCLVTPGNFSKHEIIIISLFVFHNSTRRFKVSLLPGYLVYRYMRT